MTCIIGYTDGETVWMGADSAACRHFLLERESIPKFFIKNGYIVGFTGYPRALQIVKNKMKFPKVKVSDAIERHIAVDFVDSMRKALRDGGCSIKENNKETFQGEFLVGYMGNLFTIQSNFQICSSKDPFMAIGSAEEGALAAMKALSEFYEPHEAKEMIRKALKIAEYYNSGVCRPFVIRSVK